MSSKDERSISQKESRANKLSKNPIDVPDIVKKNTLKEEAVLTHAKKYQSVFSEYFDSQRKFLLTPKNEVGVEKFICTALRPTKLPYRSLYNWESCATFISRFFQYEELDPPDQLPAIIPSPARTLKWKVGDCFDISIVLCSLLIGDGYDAYVVYGTAPKFITTRDESLLAPPPFYTPKLPTLEEEEIKPFIQKNDKEEIRNRLLPNAEKKAESKYDSQKIKEIKEIEEQKIREETQIDDDMPEQPRFDKWNRKRIHCWVMIKPNGKRPRRDLGTVEKIIDKKSDKDKTKEEKEADDKKEKERLRDDAEVYFIEPTTGREYRLSNCPYYTIEALFNHRNFWINLNPEKGINQLSLQTFHKEEQKFENVMPTALEGSPRKLEGRDLSPSKKDDSENEEEDDDQLGMPPSFSTKLNIPVEEFESMNDMQGLSAFYEKTRIDVYADYKQPDGLIYRQTVYKDFRRHLIEKMISIYANREDKLIMKIKLPFEFKVIEKYSPGKYITSSTDGHSDSNKIESHLCELEEVRGIYKTTIYYPHRTRDGLIKRKEIIRSSLNDSQRVYIEGGKTIEEYKNRYDRLIYRSVNFIIKPTEKSLDTATSYSVENIGPCIMNKATCKYSFNPEIIGEEQPEKIVFNMKTKATDIFYHIHEGSIIRKSKKITLDDKSSSSDNGPKETYSEMKERQQIIQKEKETTNQIKFAENAQKSENNAREKEKVVLEKDIFFIAKEKVEVLSAQEGRAVTKRGGHQKGRRRLLRANPTTEK